MAKTCKPVQKVVIPKGIIDPNETTIIEIPENLHDQPVVVAKRKDCPTACAFRESSNAVGSTAPDMLTSNVMCSGPCSNSAQHKSRNGSQLNRKKSSFAGVGTGCKGPCAHDVNKDGECPPFDLNETEAMERRQLQADLECFQIARRKLLCNTSNLTGTGRMK